MYRKALFLGFIFTIPFFTVGKCQSISANAFLKLSEQGNSVALQKAKLHFLTNESHTLPWIDDVELRTRTNRFLLSRQEYLIRISPMGLAHRKWQNRTHLATIHVADHVRRSKIAEELENQYELLVQNLNYTSLQEHYSLMEILYHDRLILEKEGSLTQSIQINDVLNAQADLNQIRRKIFNLKNDQQVMQLRIRQIIGSEENVSIQDFDEIDVSLIEQVLKAFNQPQVEHPLVQEQAARISLKENLYHLEKAKSNRILDFAQARYEDGESEIFFSNGFSLTAGIRIPLTGSNKTDLMELALEQKLENLELENLQVEVEQKIELKNLELTQAIDHYYLLNRQITESDIIRLLSNKEIIAAQPVSNVLNIKEEQLKAELELFRLEIDIKERYIDWLHTIGVLSSNSEINFLDLNDVKSYLLNK